jgi:Tfp pilus assembly protein PilE
LDRKKGVRGGEDENKSTVFGGFKFLGIMVFVAVIVTVVLQLIAGVVYSNIISQSQELSALLNEHINATNNAFNASRTNVQMTATNKANIEENNRILHEIADLLAANNITLTSVSNGTRTTAVTITR